MKLLGSLLEPGRLHWSVGQLADLVRRVEEEAGGELIAGARLDPRERWWARLGRTDGVEVWLLSWLPGQRTEAHDHGGAAGAFSVLQGRLTERYRVPGGSERRVVRRQGETVAFGADRAHVVANTSVAPAISVHAYSPPALPTREYGSLAEVPRRVALPAQRGAVVVELS